MKRSHVLTSAVLVALVVLASLVSAPLSIEAAPKDGDGGTLEFTPRPPGPPNDGFEALLAEPNCTWTCSDGRTGSAEVLTEKQCKNACEGACGGTCGPAAQ